MRVEIEQDGTEHEGWGAEARCKRASGRAFMRTMTSSLRSGSLGPRAAAALSLAVLVFVCVACAASPPATTGGGVAAEPQCAESTNAARARLTAVIDANMACKTDADCTTIGFGASCFDSCSRTIGVSGVDAYKAEIAAVDAKECKAYDDAGCPPMVSPPCAPPEAPACREGKCL